MICWDCLLILRICLGRFVWRGILLVELVEYTFWDHAGAASWLAKSFLSLRVHIYDVYGLLILVHYYAIAWSFSLFRPFPPVATLASLSPIFNLDIPSRLQGPKLAAASFVVGYFSSSRSKSDRRNSNATDINTSCFARNSSR